MCHNCVYGISIVQLSEKMYKKIDTSGSLTDSSLSRVQSWMQSAILLCYISHLLNYF